MSDTMSEIDCLLADLKSRTGAEISLCEDERGELFYRGKRYSAKTGEGELSERERALLQYLVSSSEAEPFQNREKRLRDIVLGESSALDTFRYMSRYHVRDGACYALDIVPEKKPGEAVSHVERCVEGTADLVVPVDDTRFCVVRFESPEQSAVEFGRFLSQSLYEELGIRARIGIGCGQNSFTDVAQSYQQAVTAVRMSGIFRSGNDVHLYRDYLLVRMLEDVPKSRLEEYLKQFDSGKPDYYEDEELCETAEQFLESNLNTAEASRRLYMHRNTLIYRLDKIESATGLNIRNFSDAVTFRIITIIYKLLHS